MSEETRESLNFIEQIIEEDLKEAKHQGRVHTRFPPEPNGYLHLGHVKAICINFETAKKYGGITNLRFDDTNPTTEETEFVENIKKDIHWLGYEWDDREYFASDYFPQLYQFAIDLIKKGLAYVDDSTTEEMAKLRGTPTQMGVDSPYKTRSIEENLDLFKRMKEGEFPDGSRVLRAKIDMTSPNMHMRDPVIYRIKHEHHHRTGDDWCIYPMYDFAHGQSDSIEEITHSLCSLEFKHHRPVYDWFIEKLEIFPSRQIEFARMNVAYTITSKRKLLKLVEKGLVNGWDDPRMATVAGMRRRGYPAAALRNFCDKAGVAKRDNVIEFELLDSCIREELNKTTPRVMGVLDPVELIIRNYPGDQVEQLESINNPEDPNMGSRHIPFSNKLYVEKKDFMIDPPRKFFRLAPGRNVRLKNAYIIHCEDYELDLTTGEVSKIYCSYYPNSKSGQDESGIKAKGTLHWVSQAHAIDAEIRIYDRLFTHPNPAGQKEKDFLEYYNEDSLKIVPHAKVEPSLSGVKPGRQLQFMRIGYFCADTDHTPEHPVFNRIVGLRDTWAKKQKK
jgi:glutaminyl-tRNA synthetase